MQLLMSKCDQRFCVQSGMTKEDCVKHSYASNCHILQEDFNLGKARNVISLHCRVASDVIKLATAENIAGSGLNLEYLKVFGREMVKMDVDIILLPKKY